MLPRVSRFLAASTREAETTFVSIPKPFCSAERSASMIMISMIRLDRCEEQEKTVRVRCMRDGEDSCGIGTSRTHRYSPCRGNKSTCRLFSLIYFPRAFLILDHTSALYDPIVVVGAVQSKLRPISTGIVRSYSLESCSRSGPHRRHF